MKHARLRAWLMGAGTPQEFVAKLGEASEHCDVSQQEERVLLVVRDALGMVMNRATMTWLPRGSHDEDQAKLR